MPKIVMLKGLPASGKTARAMELVKVGYKRINNDDLRDMIDGYKFTRGNEKIITELRETMLRIFMDKCCDIVIDNTNLNPVHKETLEEIVKAHNSVFSKKYFIEGEFINTPVEECIRRDSLRTGRHHVGKKVIMDMYKKYLYKEPEKPAHLEGKPPAIICDLDGTLAKCGDRDIYDGSKVYLDTVIPETLEILERFCDTHAIIICSGRSAEHREVTKKWLEQNSIPHLALFMRAEGDVRKDSIVKQELYEKHIKGNFNIKFVLDDRNQVVDMWRANGLTCHQVALGDF